MADEIFDEPGRAELVKEIAAILFLQPNHEYPSVVWAFLWHADLSRLQQLKSEINDPSVRLQLGELLRNVIKPGACCDTNSGQNKQLPDTPSGSGYDTPTPKSSNRQKISVDGHFEKISSSPLDPHKFSSPVPTPTGAATPQGETSQGGKKIPRDNKLKDLSYERDRKCVITQMRNQVGLNASHIYPNSLGQAGYKQSFWDGLSLFWSKEKVQEWKRTLSSAKGPEIICNMITLNALAHKAWDAGLFALKHISGNDDGHGFEMQLQFHWMQPLSPIKKTLTLTEFSSKPSFSSDAECGEDSYYLHDYTTHEIIKTGHIIHLVTVHYVDLPLPPKSLIDLQWHLHRVRALSAAAIDDELEVGDDDDDDFDERRLLASSQTTSTRIFSTQSKDDQPSSISGDSFDDKFTEPEAVATTETESVPEMMEDL